MNWAYLVRCRDGTFYAGWTTDLNKRLAAHNAGRGAKYTRGRGPLALAWAEGFATRGEAMAKEAALKKLSHAEKQALAQAYAAGGGQAGAKEAAGQRAAPGETTP